MEQNETLDALMRSYHPEDHPDNESALRAILHIVAGVALQERLGIPLSAAQRVDLKRIAEDGSPWQQTRAMLKELAR